MSIRRKILSMFLALTMVFSCCFNITAMADDSSKLDVNGYEFSVLQNDVETVTLEYIDDNENKSYTFVLNKMDVSANSAVEVSVDEYDSLSRSVNTENYELKFDNSIEYSSDSSFEGITLIDTNTQESYNVESNERFAIPLGIPLLYAAIEALLVVGSAIIIADLAWVEAEEVVTELQHRENYRYYNGILRNGKVFLGNGLVTREAQVLARTNDKHGTVFALTFKYATGLVGNVYAGPERHGSGTGYWYHIHALNGSGQRYESHIWFGD